MTDRDDWTDEERRALDGLPREEAPPAWLEERVVSTLRGRGHLTAPRSSRWKSVAGAIAASIIVFIAGLGAGVRWSHGQAAAPSGSRFVLFLYEDAGYDAPHDGEVTGRVAEYGRWAAAVRARGIGITGEKLKDDGTLLAPDAADITVAAGVPMAGEGVIAGYFVVTARDAGEAVAVARDCPHLRHRGRVSVREIDPV
ncbi:MAG: hypothetical protein HY049_18660 [Acidobacteria bacterium]|nr:hypothetical protein [Acidobacteriota bacterium]